MCRWALPPDARSMEDKPVDSTESGAGAGAAPSKKAVVITEILPKTGLVYSEKGNLSEVLCKPKIMPIKSESLLKLESLEKSAAQKDEDGVA